MKDGRQSFCPYVPPVARTTMPEGIPLRCLRCEGDTPPGAKFCIEGSTPLKPCCPQCGADILLWAKFCGACGTPHTVWTPDPPLLSYSLSQVAEKIATFRSTWEGEHKQVTVLPADLKITVALLVAQDPKQARQLLHLVLERRMADAERSTQLIRDLLRQQEPLSEDRLCHDPG